MNDTLRSRVCVGVHSVVARLIKSLARGFSNHTTFLCLEDFFLVR